MEYVWLVIDVAFLYYFVNAMAHEAGWWSSGFLRWSNPYQNFGRNNVLMLMLDGAFAMLWIWILIDDIKEVIA